MARVSVIIPAYNESRYLPVTLDALGRQTVPRDQFEIIVIDNGSTDGTQDIARARADLLLEMPRVTVAALRNHGASRATGSILAFLDADCIPAETWLEEGLRSAAEVRSVTGYEYEIPKEAGWIADAWFCVRELGRAEVTHINSGNLVLPHDLFDEIGGFDEALATGEDTEFCARARRTAPVISDSRIVVYHYGVPRTPGQFFRREVWLGLGAFGTFRQNWRDKPLLATLGFAIGTTLQIFGFIQLMTGGSGTFLSVGTGLVAGVLAASIFYRRKYVRGVQHILQLVVLYYLFYLGRTVSFFHILRGKSSYHGNKSK
jgi:glycosyltransferase involved in cell wall biosynthesis